MFKCKVCSAKDELIAQLRSEISYLRQLAIPQNDPLVLPAFVREMEAVVGGHEESVEASQQPPPQASDDLDSIVGGTY